MSGAPTATPPRPRPGRPSSGARERILEGCLEVLKSDGYAGLTTGKVAAVSGESKALIAYHFGSKAGMVTAAARQLGAMITEHIVRGLAGARTVEEVITGALGGVWELMEHDERLPRAYFDLNAVSVVDDEVRAVVRDVKREFRRVLVELLEGSERPVSAERAPAAAILIIAGIEGLCLERIERGETAELAAARELFVDSMAGAIAR